jgi:serine/threonine protein kinase
MNDSCRGPAGQDVCHSHRLVARLSVGFSAEIWKCELNVPSATPSEAVVRISHRSYDRLTQPELLRLQQVTALAGIPGLPRYREIGEWLGRLYVVTDFAESDCAQLVWREDLSEELRVQQVLGLVREVAFCLDRLSEHGLVHGAIAPHHILICNRGAVLTGFSLMHRFPNAVRRVDRSDLLRWLCMSPEMQTGASQETSDQYSLAATYLVLRTRRFGFVEGSWRQDCVGRLEEQERRVLLKALAHSPRDRFRTCCEFVEQLCAHVGRESAGTGK